MKICNFIFFTFVAVCVGGMVLGSVNTEKAPQHTPNKLSNISK